MDKTLEKLSPTQRMKILMREAESHVELLFASKDDNTFKLGVALQELLKRTNENNKYRDYKMPVCFEVVIAIKNLARLLCDPIGDWKNDE